MDDPDDVRADWWFRVERKKRVVGEVHRFMDSTLVEDRRHYACMCFPKALYPAMEDLPTRRMSVPIWPDLKR